MLKNQDDSKVNHVEEHSSSDKAILVRPYLSIVIPCYNEESRLPDTLNQLSTWLNSQDKEIEVLLVDDGSEDNTPAVAEDWFVQHDQLTSGIIGVNTNTKFRLIRNAHRGKAYSVRSGVLQAAGNYILFSDADLSTPISEVGKLLSFAVEGYEVVIGSREGLGAHRYNEPFYRHLMGRVFNLVVRLVMFANWQDTQCGFKLMRRDAAQHLFTAMRLYDEDSPMVKGAMVTGFDVEMLFLARKLGYRVKEVSVEWVHRPGSKVNPAKDSLRLLKDLFKVRWNSLRGYYKNI